MVLDEGKEYLIQARLAALGGGGGEPDVAYVAGLLHDLGKPVVAALLLEDRLREGAV
jgi:hypothetical protein